MKRRSSSPLRPAANNQAATKDLQCMLAIPYHWSVPYRLNQLSEDGQQIYAAHRDGLKALQPRRPASAASTPRELKTAIKSRVKQYGQTLESVRHEPLPTSSGGGKMNLLRNVWAWLTCRCVTWQKRVPWGIMYCSGRCEDKAADWQRFGF